jgi:hypothetical protein
MSERVAPGTYPNVPGASFIRPYPGNVGTLVGRNRLVLRRVWNGDLTSRGRNVLAMGTFRIANNAGDPLSRKNFSAGGPNMVSSTGRSKLHLASNRDGGQAGTAAAIPVATTNVKYVYDSSNFTRFKKQQTVNYGYAGLGTINGDYTAGGANNGANSPLRLARIH